MKRSLRRRIIRSINRTWSADAHYGRGMVGLAILFPADAFADAPTWRPGPGFRALNNESVHCDSFVRDNGDGTQTVVVAGLQAEGPAMDGGPWTEDEVWTVTAPVKDFDHCGLGNAPHGLTEMSRVPGADIRREAYATHPVAAVEAFWVAFEQRWGFVPRSEHGRHGWPFADGQTWVSFICNPEYAWVTNDETALLETAVTIARHFRAQVRVYPYSLKTSQITGPLGNTFWNPDLGTVTTRLNPDSL
ncbi:hypothetical protein [Streptomyces niveus]|uniref:hypothetical protein n=1 Tax=Streptomyces niveus TaxID=193462 RepID=UPI003417148F